MLITPESNGTLPEKEAKMLENVRTEIIIGEQKIKQLQVAERQLKGEIQSSLNDKVRIAVALEGLEAEKSSLQIKTGEAQTVLNTLNKDIIEAKDNLTAVIEKINKKETSLNAQEKSLSERESLLEVRDKEYKNNILVLQDSKKKHDEKVNKLLNALK